VRREFIARVRNKTFIVMTFVSPLIFVGMIAVISWLTTLNENEVRQVAILDQTNVFKSYFKDSKKINYHDYNHLGLEAAKDSVLANEYYGLVYIPNNISYKELEKEIQFYSKDAPNMDVLGKIEKTIAEVLTNQNFKQKGLDLSLIDNAKADVRIQIENFSGEKMSNKSNYVKMFFGGLAGYFLLMFVVIYGNMVMRSVIEEKTSRIIEVIISSVKPIYLMMGKILGTTLAGVLQFFIWVVFGGILFIVFTSYFGIEMQPDTTGQLSETLSKESADQLQLIVQDVLKLPIFSLILLFLVYFIGGYFLYSSIYAAIGAAVDSETDSQQFMLPIIVPLMLAFYVGVFAVIENPHGTVSTVFSMIPLTSPIVMLMRVPFGVDWWQVLISILILFGSIWFMIVFAAKIYRVGILMYGKKPTYKEIFKWLKY